MIKDNFKKNGLYYKLLDRTDKAALFELTLPTGEMAGYEVAKIHYNRAGVRFGKYFPASESIPSNDQFGFDGSKAFFPADYNDAVLYLQEFTLGSKISATFTGGVVSDINSLPIVAPTLDRI